MRIRTIFDRMRQDGRGGRGKAELLTGIEGFQPLGAQDRAAGRRSPPQRPGPGVRPDIASCKPLRPMKRPPKVPEVRRVQRPISPLR